LSSKFKVQSSGFYNLEPETLNLKLKKFFDILARKLIRVITQESK